MEENGALNFSLKKVLGPLIDWRSIDISVSDIGPATFDRFGTTGSTTYLN